VKRENPGTFPCANPKLWGNWAVANGSCAGAGIVKRENPGTFPCANPKQWAWWGGGGGGVGAEFTQNVRGMGGGSQHRYQDRQQQVTQMDNHQVPRNTQKTHQFRSLLVNGKGCPPWIQRLPKRDRWTAEKTPMDALGNPKLPKWISIRSQGTPKRPTNSVHY
jgi:hypothetical protein